MKRIILLLLLLISIQGFSQTQDNRTPVNVITPYIPPPGYNLDSVRLLGSMWTGTSWVTRTFYGADVIRYDLKKADTTWVATHAWAQNSFPAIQRFLDSLSAVRTALASAVNSGNASSVPWSGITSTPTTLQGYGLLGDAYSKGQIDATFAPLYSPSLAGTPTGPTAVAGSSNNQLATTAFVQNAVAASTTGVSSFIGRSGAVSAQSGDYSSFYPILSGSYANPSWITSLAWSKITGATTLDSTNAQALHSQAYYDVRYKAPIDANTTSIASNTASINTINSYYTGSVIKPTSLPIGTSTTLGAYKIGSGLAADVNGVLSATGGSNVWTLNNLQTDIVVYTGSNTLTLRQNANKVNAVWVFDTVANQVVQVPRALFSFTPGTNQVTFVQGSGGALQSGDKIWIDYDIGAAYGIMDSTVAIGLHSEAYYNTKYAKTITLTTTGTSGASTWNPTTGALNIPQYSGGAGGSSFPTQQVDATTGTTVTVTNQTGNIWLIKNPATTVASYTITFPPTPVDGQRMWISFGGTISSGVVVSSLSVAGNTFNILQTTFPSTVNAGETLEYQFTNSNNTWYRIK